MLFADIVGSTALASGRDPEEVRARLERYFAAAREVLDAHGGTVEKFIGDAVVAVFGVPRSHGDDPDRAVRAGLELVARVGDLGVGLRVGIATGEVLAAAPGADLAVAGDAVNAAARVQQGAPAGGVLVDARTAQACRAASLEPAGEVVAKGFDEPIAVFSAASGAPAALRDTPLLGRDDDLALLRLVARRAFAARAPALVTLVGEAGLGKTRLARELVRDLRADGAGPRVLVGVSPPYGSGIAFWALGEIVRAAAGTAPDAPAGEVRAALAAVLREHGAADAEAVADGLALALGRDDESAARSDDRVRRAWRRLLTVLAGHGPLLLVLDDIHWADEGLLDLVEEIAGGLGELPLVALCTARPELLDRRPRWAGGLRGATAVDLRPLAQQEARALAEALLGPSGHALSDRVAELAGGNPFFTEEVAHRLAEAADEVLPDTVQGAVAARIDLLPDDEKRAVQRAAVLGATFSADGLAALLGTDPGLALRGLARREIVVELAGEAPGAHRFRHQLLRDVAYRSLPRAARAELHERAAEWVAGSAGARLAELEELVAFHREQAATLDPSTERERAAVEALRDAAGRAERRGAVEGAQGLLERAAKLASEPAAAAACLRDAAGAALGRMRGDLAVVLLRRAADLDETGRAIDLAAVVELHTRMVGITGILPVPELEQLLERARSSAAPSDRVAEAAILSASVWLTDEDDLQAAERVLALAREVGEPALLSSAFDAVAGKHLVNGRLRAALDATRARAATARGLSGRGGRSFLERRDYLYMLATTLTRVGELREAAAVIEESRDVERQAGIDYLAHVRGVDCLFMLGEWERVGRDLELFAAAWDAAGRPTAGFVRKELAVGSLIHGLRGDHAGWAPWRELATRLGGAIDDVDLAGYAGHGLIFVGDAMIDLHFERPAEAAARLTVRPAEVAGWHRSTWATVRAEAYVRAGHDEAEASLADAAPTIDEDAVATARLLRARALHAGDDALLREARDAFAALEVPYELARTQLDLGGAEADEGRAAYGRLGLSTD
ncbi:MAG TPA: AAA family ATPase [Solirubrobacteraceae bacterium]|nr:AAA family ATPase [Solirubrobacteraceae bacterium]